MTCFNSTSEEDYTPEQLQRRTQIGVTLAICGNLLISIALNILKHAHNVNAARDTPIAYTRMKLWWIGVLLTVFGEAGNFIAFGFAEATLITPLGALSVISNVFISSFALGEGFHWLDVLGSAFAVIGGVVLVGANAPHEEKLTIDKFLHYAQQPKFVVYIIALVIALVVIRFFLCPRYGKKHVVFYLLLCSLIGSITVLCSKAVSTFVNLAFSGCLSTLANPLPYALILLLVVTAMTQLRYLNTAMQYFGNSQTVPVYYVLFTICTVVGSGMLYQDFNNMSTADFLLFLLGCCMTFMGVGIITMHGRPDKEGIKAKEQLGEALLEPGDMASAADVPTNSQLQQSFQDQQSIVSLNVGAAQNTAFIIARTRQDSKASSSFIAPDDSETLASLSQSYSNPVSVLKPADDELVRSVSR